LDSFAGDREKEKPIDRLKYDEDLNLERNINAADISNQNINEGDILKDNHDEWNNV